MSEIKNQNLISNSSSSVIKLHEQSATLYSGSHQIETDITDNETVFVTTEDDGAGGTVTFVQNIKGENISKDDGMVETEYVLEDNLPATTVEIDHGRFFLITFIIGVRLHINYSIKFYVLSSIYKLIHF